MGNRDLDETPLSSACSCESPRVVVGTSGSQHQRAWAKKECSSERWWVNMDRSEEREQGKWVRWNVGPLLLAFPQSLEANPKVLTLSH